MWLISRTEFRQSGLQFVAPVFIIFVLHSFWLLNRFGVERNITEVIFQETLKTCMQILGFVVLSIALVPEPANGNSSEEILGGIGIFLVCLLMIVVVMLVLWLAISVTYKATKRLTAVKEKDSDHQQREIATVVVVIGLLSVLSAEGVVGLYGFQTNKSATASVNISASANNVWDVLEIATSPKFPLPKVLWMIPRPVDVVVDEGVQLHANRVVKFKGREGAGYLRLKVVDKSDDRAVFEVLSDDSPIAEWSAHRTLTYQVTGDGPHTKLTVKLEYDRLLAPAWFFNMMIGLAATQAMDVLARDVKARAEALSKSA